MPPIAAGWAMSRGWLASGAAHAGLLAVLACLPAARLAFRDGVHLQGAAAGESTGEPQVVQVELTPPAARAVASAVMAPPSPAPSALQVPDPFERQAADSAALAGYRRGPFDDAMRMAGRDAPLSAGTENAGPTRGNSAPEGADFFGVRAQGSRFAFVVDCSLSMKGVKWQSACEELAASIRRLHEDQEFYVIFFDGEAHLMFNQRPREATLIAATPANLALLREWLLTVRLGYNTEPCDAMTCAVELQPDAVFLLSDGEFEAKTSRYLRLNNIPPSEAGEAGQVAVHTIGFHSRKGEKMLRLIAAENAGEYRFVK